MAKRHWYQQRAAHNPSTQQR